MSDPTVVCPLNSYPGAERALPSAYDAAALMGSRLELFSAVEDSHMVGRRAAYLDGIGADARGPAVEAPVTTVVVDPHAPRAIAALAAQTDKFVVMATSTQPLMHTGYVGSAAQRVASDAHNNVLLYGPHATTRLSDVERVVVPCDGSRLSEGMLLDAQDWAQRLSRPLWVVSSLSLRDARGAGYSVDAEANYVRELAEPLGAEWEVLHGDNAAKSIVDWAENALIAMTTHGRSGLKRLTMGSVTVETTRWASGPVLVSNGRRVSGPQPSPALVRSAPERVENNG